MHQSQGKKNFMKKCHYRIIEDLITITVNRVVWVEKALLLGMVFKSKIGQTWDIIPTGGREVRRNDPNVHKVSGNIFDAILLQLRIPCF